jgi:hypothetical protein
MMAPFVYEEARANAPLHIQLRCGRMAPPYIRPCDRKGPAHLPQSRRAAAFRTEDKFLCTNYKFSGLGSARAGRHNSSPLGSHRSGALSGGVPRVLGSRVSSRPFPSRTHPPSNMASRMRTRNQGIFVRGKSLGMEEMKTFVDMDGVPTTRVTLSVVKHSVLGSPTSISIRRSSAWSRPSSSRRIQHGKLTR